MDENKSIWKKTADELTVKDQLVITAVLTGITVGPMVVVGVVSNLKWKLARRRMEKISNTDDVIDITI